MLWGDDINALTHTHLSYLCKMSVFCYVLILVSLSAVVHAATFEDKIIMPDVTLKEVTKQTNIC